MRKCNRCGREYDLGTEKNCAKCLERARDWMRKLGEKVRAEREARGESVRPGRPRKKLMSFAGPSSVPDEQCENQKACAKVFVDAAQSVRKALKQPAVDTCGSLTRTEAPRDLTVDELLKGGAA